MKQKSNVVSIQKPQTEPDYKQLFFGVLYTQGRVRVPRKSFDLLHENDDVVCTVVGDDVVFNFTSGRPKPG